MQVYENDLYDFLSQFTQVFRGVLPSGMSADTYILINMQENETLTQFIQPFIIYTHKTTSFARIKAIKDNIANAIDNGLIYKSLIIYKGTPFYQDRTDEAENTKSGYINLLITRRK